MPGWRILLWAVLVLISLFFIYLVRGVLFPFVVSFILAALLDPTVRNLRLRGLSRQFAVFIVIGGFFAVMVGIGILIAPSISRETTSLAERVQNLTASISRQGEDDNFFVRWNPSVNPEKEGSFTYRVDSVLARFSPTLERMGLPSTRREIMEQYVDKNRPQIAKAVQGYSNSAFGILTNIFSQLTDVILVAVLVPLMLGEMDNLRRRAPKWIPPAIRSSTMVLFGDIGQIFVKYLRGISTVVITYAITMTTYLWIMGVPSWVLLGPLFACLYLVPYIGNIIASVTVLTVIGFSNVTGGFFHPFASAWEYAGLVMFFYLCIGAVFDHLVYPQMVGNSVGLSPVLSVFVILCGGALFGLPGMMVAFPIAGSIKVILDRIIRVTSSSQEGLNLPTVPLRHRTS